MRADREPYPQDLRTTAEFLEARELVERRLHPGTGRIVHASELNAARDGRHAIFTGTMVDELDGTPPTRVCRVDLISGRMQVLTFGPNTDRAPKFSPDGRTVAFLSDRTRRGDFQLHLLDLDSGVAHAAPSVDGWVEYLSWSPSGSQILLGVAGHGADIAGGQGATRTAQAPRDLPAWTPAVETGEEDCRWRSAWVYDLRARQARSIDAAGANVWEAAWCGDDALTAIVSSGPGEGLWYTAHLSRIAIASGNVAKLYASRAQLGWVSAAPSGARVAVVEAICSDRWIVAGDLKLIDVEAGSARTIDTKGIDITYTEWRSESRLLLAGYRGFETVVAVYDLALDEIQVSWCSDELTSSGSCASVAGLGDAGDCVLVGQGFRRAPELGVVRQGQYRRLCRLPETDQEDNWDGVLDKVEHIVWRAPDGRFDIQGWLLTPRGFGAPFPLVMQVHGGPVYHWRPGPLSVANLMLLKRGYALFLPNPRGSSGRGQEFARAVLGDIGGADSRDLLSGVDHLLARGLADPARLGVMGGSYGGYMTSWLITQDPRFAAAVSVAPVTNRIFQRLTANHPQFIDLFVGDSYRNLGGRYFQRSPIMHAHNARTPTLNIAGALDRCTPPAEAVQFHNALRENDVRSALVIYPQEGHGIRKLPASIDYAARVVGWFLAHMPAGG